MSDDEKNTAEEITFEESESENKLHSNLSISSEAAQDHIMALPVEITISVGSARMRFRDIFDLTTESVVDLNSKVSDPVQILVGERVIADGELIETTPGSGHLSVRIKTVFNHEA